MDPDGQRHHLLLGRPDWARGRASTGESLAAIWAEEIGDRPADAPGWDDERAELTLAPRAETLAPTPGETPPALDARRATAADAGGNVYWVAADAKRLMVRSHGDGRITAFWPDPRAGRPAHDLFTDLQAPPEPDRRYVALAVTADAWLVAAFESSSGNGHDAFDLVAGGPPMTTLWPTGVGTAFDMAASADGGLLILDRTAHRLIALDAKLQVTGTTEVCEADVFQPVGQDSEAEARRHSSPGGGGGPRSGGGGSPQASSPAAGPLHQPAAGPPPPPGEEWDDGTRSHVVLAVPLGRDLTPIIATADPIAIEALPDGRIALLTRTPDRLWLLPADDGPVPAPIPLDFAPLDLLYGEVLLRGGERAMRLLVAGGTGNQLRAFRIDDPGAHATPEMFPLRRYGGRSLVAIQGRASYDSGDAPTYVPVVERPRRRYATTAIFVSPVFDGAIPQTVWDRLQLDACIPPGSRVTVEARAADDRDGDALPAPWTAQPAPALTGEQATNWYGAAAVQTADKRAGRGTWEMLFQRLTGRYAQIRLTLSADGDATPRLRAFRASYPRQSWSDRYLPAVYREEPGPADFLARFLANLQGTTTGIERRIADAQALFDPRTAPKEALDWLADWFDTALDPAWEDSRRRRFIAHAATFFGWRGTIRGLESALAIAFDADLDGTLFGDADACCADCESDSSIRIIEAWLTRRTPPVVIGDPEAPAGLDLAQPGERWTPAEGNAGLAQRLATSLGHPVNGITPVPLYDSAGDGAKWQQAMAQALGFVPTAGAEERAAWIAFQLARGHTPVDLPRFGDPETTDWQQFVAQPSRTRQLWQRFLAGRYRRPAALQSAYGTVRGTFANIGLPDRLPPTAAAQADWLQFEGILLAMAARAHRFSVLLPLKPGDATDAATLEGLRRLATRIIALEKPAHTVFDVRFYFAMNRLGEARLGLDTRLGQGSRAPELLPPAILGRAYAGESFIGPDGPADTPGRRRLAC